MLVNYQLTNFTSKCNHYVFTSKKSLIYNNLEGVLCSRSHRTSNTRDQPPQACPYFLSSIFQTPSRGSQQDFFTCNLGSWQGIDICFSWKLDPWFSKVSFSQNSFLTDFLFFFISSQFSSHYSLLLFLFSSLYIYLFIYLLSEFG